MEIPEATIEAAIRAYEDDYDLEGNHSPARQMRAGLRAALPALQEQWEEEVIKAMRSKRVLQLILGCLPRMQGKRQEEAVAKEIVDALTLPQIVLDSGLIPDA